MTNICSMCQMGMHALCVGCACNHGLHPRRPAGPTNSLPLGTTGQYSNHVPAFMAQLRPGVAGIRSSYDIARAMGVNQRAVGYIARDARLMGHLVGSDHGRGYYLIQTSAEVQSTCDHLSSRIQGVQITLNALRASAHAAGL